ncbi:MAG TPA: PDZ domain-containing protein [Pirellulales bacterium]|nr:PDZ domain-containing protein [Pirellulales bacterium]
MGSVPFITEVVLVWLTAVAASILLNAVSDAAEGEDAAPGVLAEAPIEQECPILLRVRVQPKNSGRVSTGPERTYCMLLDTGADRTCFDVRHRGLLGDATSTYETSNAFGSAVTEAYESPVMQLGEVSIHPTTRVACIDLQWFSDGIGEQVDGLLGMDALREFVISIDFDARKLQFHRAARPDFGRCVPITWRGEFGAERPFVEAAFEDGVTETFLIDTAAIGNFSATLNSTVYDGLVKKGILARVEGAHLARGSARLITMSGTGDVTVARAKFLTLAGFSLKQLVVYPHPRVSTLGLSYLSRYSVEFDFPNGVMYLCPSERFVRPDVWYDLTSFGVLKRDDGAVVETVRSDGWGANAGIKQGDLILAINGRNLKGMSLFAIRRMLAVESRQAFEIRRHGVKRRIVLDVTREIQRLLREGVEEVKETDSTKSRRN